MTRVLLPRYLIIIACILAYYNDHYIHVWQDWLILARISGCIIVFCLVLKSEGFDLALSSVMLALCCFETLDEIRKVNTQIFVGDLFFDFIGLLYLIRYKYKTYILRLYTTIIKWQKSKTKY